MNTEEGINSRAGYIHAGCSVSSKQIQSIGSKKVPKNLMWEIHRLLHGFLLSTVAIFPNLGVPRCVWDNLTRCFLVISIATEVQLSTESLVRQLELGRTS